MLVPAVLILRAFDATARHIDAQIRALQALTEEEIAIVVGGMRG